MNYNWTLKDLADLLEIEMTANTETKGWLKPTVRVNFCLDKCDIEDLIKQLRESKQ